MEEYKDNTNEYELEEYNKLATMLNKDTDNFNSLMERMPPSYAQTDGYIKGYVSNLSREALRKRADALIIKQNLGEHDELIDHMTEKNKGDLNHFRSQWSPIMWQANEKENTQKVKIGDKVVEACDLNFSIAETIEKQDSHTDPLTEYYSWVERQQEIEADIKTNGTTLEELAQRKFFIKYMDVRETEIKRVASLYASAALSSNSAVQELAQEKLKFVLFKLGELRRLRDRMKATRAIPTRRKKTLDEITEEKKKKQATYYDFYGNDTRYTPVANSLNEQHLNDKLCACALTAGVGYTLLQMRPESQNETDANNKIETTLSNHENMRKMLHAMRNGISPEEWSNSQYEDSYETHETSPTPVHQLRGFDLVRYNQALRELNS